MTAEDFAALRTLIRSVVVVMALLCATCVATTAMGAKQCGMVPRAVRP